MFAFLLDDSKCLEARITLCNCFINTIEQNSTIAELPQEYIEFINQHHQFFKEFDETFRDNYNDLDIYISDIFNNFVDKKIKDNDFSFLSMDDVVFIDLIIYMNEFCDKQKIEHFPFDVCFSLVQILSQKYKTFKNSVLFVRNTLRQHRVSTDSRLLEYKEKTEILEATTNQAIDIVNTTNKEFVEKTKNILNTFDTEKKKILTKINRLKDTVTGYERKTYETSVTILGIFSAIVLTFSTTVSFFTSTIDAFSHSSIYKVLIILITVGMICVNVCMGLFYYLGRVCKGNRFYTSANANKKKKTSSLKPFITTNVILMILLILVFSCWGFGVVEQRNKAVTNALFDNISSAQHEQHDDVVDK